jgi:hypothetical protein
MKDGTHGTINTTTSLLAFADLLIPSFLRRDSTGLFSASNLGMVLDFGVRYAGGKDRGQEFLLLLARNGRGRSMGIAINEAEGCAGSSILSLTGDEVLCLSYHCHT